MYEAIAKLQTEILRNSEIYHLAIGGCFLRLTCATLLHFTHVSTRTAGKKTTSHVFRAESNQLSQPFFQTYKTPTLNFLDKKCVVDASQQEETTFFPLKSLKGRKEK